jgi:exodeoxyribonuclease VII large subunit
MRAPTPSAAAELAVFSYEEFENELSRYAFKLSREMEIKCTGIQQRITGYARELEHASPVHRLKEKRQYAENLTQRLQSDMQWVLGQKRSAMAILAGRLDGASPAKKLSQGYGFVTDAEGRHISGVGQVKEGDDLHLYLQDGKLITTIKEIDEDKTWNKQ